MAFIISFILGGLFGVFLMCLLQINKGEWKNEKMV